MGSLIMFLTGCFIGWKYLGNSDADVASREYIKSFFKDILGNSKKKNDLEK